jgi:hypothetical protein
LYTEPTIGPVARAGIGARVEPRLNPGVDAGWYRAPMTDRAVGPSM